MSSSSGKVIAGMDASQIKQVSEVEWDGEADYLFVSKGFMNLR